MIEINTESNDSVVAMIEPESLSPKDILAKKTVSCMVDLGVDVINKMIGDSVSLYGNPAELPTLVAAAIINELTF